MDEKGKIIIRRISRNRETGIPEEEFVRVSSAGRWFVYLAFVPLVIVMAVLGIFFFTAFFALFAIAAIGFAFRLWWLRRKLRQSTEAEEVEYAVIEDAEIVDEKTDKPDDK
ncbi:MAG: hypothetical protein M3Q16_04415 [Pseudomonadota bacterium]|nr:hypothetical protein [Pseudomonadota bacterium]